jgi:hypothetical protein
MCAAQPAPSVVPATSTPDLKQDIEGAIATLEDLAVNAAYAQVPCAQVLFHAAELLRLAVLQR